MMGIRIQPKEIIISDDSRTDLFENDLPAWKKSVEFPARLTGSIEEPCTIRCDGINHCNLP